jgi:hypothetical protein
VCRRWPRGSRLRATRSSHDSGACSTNAVHERPAGPPDMC